MAGSVAQQIQRLVAKLGKFNRTVSADIARGINDTAFRAITELRRQASLKLDRPTPFTLSGFRYNKATPTSLNARVYVDPLRARYMMYQVLGGTRRPRGKKFIPVPVGIRLNQYGNIAGKQRGLVRNDRQFLGTIKGVHGVWERQRSGKVKLLVEFERSVQYKARFPFYKIVQGIAKTHLLANIERRLQGTSKRLGL
jgi:hypothetical protein